MVQLRSAATAVLLAGLAWAGPALAQSDQPPDFSPATAAEARDIVEKSTSIVRTMMADERLAGLLARSKGVFILPNVLKGGLVIGGRGGEGVLLTHEDGTWSNPAFFDLGALTLGAQAGGAVGPLVMLLMSDEAVRRFSQENEFAIDASAGLSVFGYDVVERASSGDGDVIVWSDQGGAFAGATIGASDISPDPDKNRAYYMAPVGLEAILEGKVENPHPKRLQEELTGDAPAVPG